MSRAFPAGKTWDNAKAAVTNGYRTLDRKESHLDGAKEALGDLNNQWQTNEEKIKDGTAVTVDAAVNLVINLVGVIPTQGATVVTYLPPECPEAEQDPDTPCPNLKPPCPLDTAE